MQIYAATSAFFPYERKKTEKKESKLNFFWRCHQTKKEKRVDSIKESGEVRQKNFEGEKTMKKKQKTRLNAAKCVSEYL